MSVQKKILLAVCGISPQIITETFYALIMRDPPWIPDEIFVVTTEVGKNSIQLQLFGDEGHFQKLLRDYQVEKKVVFSEENIITIVDEKGVPLSDLRTPEENEAAANTICKLVCQLTNQSETQLHVSLAGGRKTMGFYAGYALSLFGRAHDSLSHVLVSQAYESLRDFFYPTPYRKVVFDRQEQPHDANFAKVWLADIPFVRLRHFLNDKAMHQQLSFSEVVAMVEKVTKKEKSAIVVDVNSRMVKVDDIEFSLPPSQLAFYLIFSRQTVRHGGPISIEKSMNLNFRDQYFEFLELVKPGFDHNDMSNSTAYAYRHGMSEVDFQSLKSKTNRHFKKYLGEVYSEPYLIQSGQRAQSQYFLAIDPKLIELKMPI